MNNFLLFFFWLFYLWLKLTGSSWRWDPIKAWRPPWRFPEGGRNMKAMEFWLESTRVRHAIKTFYKVYMQAQSKGHRRITSFFLRHTCSAAWASLHSSYPWCSVKPWCHPTPLCLTSCHLCLKDNFSGYRFLLYFSAKDFLYFFVPGSTPTTQYSSNILHLHEISIIKKNSIIFIEDSLHCL